MVQERTRRLAAVWFADIAGYTTLSARDEDAALAVVDELQRLTPDIVRSHGGRVVKFIGDSALAVFDSTDGAIRAALSLQSAFKQSETAVRHGSGLRIGVHVGEIVEAPDGDVYGDGVNVASRLERASEPGTVVASESAARQVENRGHLSLTPLGEHEFKGGLRPIKVFLVELDSETPTHSGHPVVQREAPGPSGFADALADQYRIEEEIGRGGMATVYRATDLRHERTVAVKLMHPELTDSVGAERFLREIQVTANLQHPHVLPLFDSGALDGWLYYVMPLMEGASLRDRLLRETQLGIGETIKTMRDIASALAHAHERDVVHRDIKPENILFSGDYAVLADFGVARAVTRAAGDGLTGSGLAMGSPPYMAPEQMKDAGVVDGRTDIYALGCVMYEMLVGSPPFTGSTAQVVMARHATDPVPPIRTVRSTVPEELEEVVMRCLAKVPADRYQDTSQLVAALDSVSVNHAALTATTQRTPSTETKATADSTPERSWTPLASHRVATEGGHVAAGERRPFLEELKHRNVYRAAVIYIVAAMGLTQAAELSFPTFGLTDYFDFVVMAAVLGFPLTLVLAWGYDLTLRGLRRATPYGSGTLGGGVSVTGARRRDLGLRVLGLAGAVLFLALFPFYQDVSVRKVTVSRQDARTSAEAFLAERGWGGAFEEVSILEMPTGLNDFLQSQIGLRWASGPMAERVAPWTWRFRWFRPGLNEEWRVSVGPGGRIVDFEHTTPSAEDGASLSEEEALQVAEAFLGTQGVELSSLVSEGTSATSQSNRTQYSFEWLVSDLTIPWSRGPDAAPEGYGRVGVTVTGDRISAFRNEFVVPEDFLRARNARTAVFSVLIALIILSLFGASIARTVSALRSAQESIPWKEASLVAAAAGACMALVGALGMNELILDLPSELPAIVSTLIPVGYAIFFFVFFGGAYFLLAAVAISGARRYYPLTLDAWDKVRTRQWRAREVTDSIAGGIFLAGVLVGLDALSSFVTTRFPGVYGVVLDELAILHGTNYPIAASALSALLDVFVVPTTVLAALVLLRHHLKSTTMAVGLLAIAGAFASDIPVDPVYLSGVFAAASLAVVSIAMVRWGPVMIAVAAFVQECVQVGSQSLVGGNESLRTVGLVLLACAVLPMAYVLLSKLPRDDVAPEASTT